MFRYEHPDYYVDSYLMGLEREEIEERTKEYLASQEIIGLWGYELYLKGRICFEELYELAEQEIKTQIKEERYGHMSAMVE